MSHRYGGCLCFVSRLPQKGITLHPLALLGSPHTQEEEGQMRYWARARRCTFGEEWALVTGPW